MGVRELQQNAADVLRRVAAGESVQVTLRGRPVAQLVPAREAGLEALVSAGLARPAEMAPRDLPAPPTAGRGAKRTLGELLAESRDSERYRRVVTYYLDTSAFLKLVVREAGTSALRRWVRDHDPAFFASELLRVEALRTARRHSPDAVASVRQRLAAVTLVAVTTAICEHAADLDPSILHSLDAIHLATALAVGDDLEGIVTYDDRLAEAALGYGIAVVAPTG